MGQIEDLLFETERRVILFKSGTTMPDASQLGWNADPNNVVNGNTDGETLIYMAPTGTRYQEDDGTQWYKKAMPNNWDTFGGGVAANDSSEAKSIAVIGESVADKAESMARFNAIDDFRNYSMAASGAGGSRVGKLVHKTTTLDTVALAKADAEATMPAIGVITLDLDSAVRVKSVQTIYTNIKADSEATVATGDNVWVSTKESGKATSSPPNVGVCQLIGVADKAESEGNIDLQFSPMVMVGL